MISENQVKTGLFRDVPAGQHFLHFRKIASKDQEGRGKKGFVR